MTVRETYAGSDGEATKALYARLESLGPAGVVALNLFRAQKCSSRAKQYRRGTWKRDAYDRKNWSLQNLCAALTGHAAALNIFWGWKMDPEAEGPHCWVLYVNLPPPEQAHRPGEQVSFHSGTRGPGPDYPGEWDRQHASEERILRWCEGLLLENRKPNLGLAQKAESRNPPGACSNSWKQTSFF